MRVRGRACRAQAVPGLALHVKAGGGAVVSSVIARKAPLSLLGTRPYARTFHAPLEPRPSLLEERSHRARQALLLENAFCALCRRPAAVPPHSEEFYDD